MTPVPPFIPGLVLCADFFTEVVKPLLDTQYPKLCYSVGRLDQGSEVLGYDTDLSTDHDWGLRLQLFVMEQDMALKDELNEFFAEKLPASFRGYSTHFGEPDHEGTRLLVSAADDNPIAHRITITTPTEFFASYLGCVPSRRMAPQQWLTLSEQKLATIRSGQLFRDELNLNAYRALVEYYPRDVWLYLMAAQWMKISQEEPFVGRCHLLKDTLGARVIAARLVQIMMHLCFLLDRTYAPYSKWFGTGFANLRSGIQLKGTLERALTTDDPKIREASLCEAYTALASRHNMLGITKPLAANVRPFFTRPFMVIQGDRFAHALQAAIVDETIRQWPLIGSVNQLSATVDFLENDVLLRTAQSFYVPGNSEE